MYRFQYFLSVVPTVYIANDFTRKVIETNQYAVTEQSHSSAGALGHEVPGPVAFMIQTDYRDLLQIRC